MIGSRIRQFREYCGMHPEQIAKSLGVEVQRYLSFEEGTEIPTIDILEKIAAIYKITLDELYGYSPRMTVMSPDREDRLADRVQPDLLKMSDLSWEEQQLILTYRLRPDKEWFIQRVLEQSVEDNTENGRK